MIKLTILLHHSVYTKDTFRIDIATTTDGKHIKIKGNYTVEHNIFYDITGDYVYNDKYKEDQFIIDSISQITLNDNKKLLSIYKLDESLFKNHVKTILANQIDEEDFNIWYKKHGEQIGESLVSNSFDKLLSSISKDDINVEVSSIYNKLKTLLASKGVTDYKINTIYQQYGDASIRILESNPYALINDIKGFGFKIVDYIATQLGMERNSSVRHKAIVKYLIDREVQNGHVFTFEATIIANAYEKLGIILNVNIVTDMVIAGDLVGVKKNNELQIYLPAIYYAEKRIASKLKSIMKTKSKLDTVFGDNIDNQLNEKISILESKMAIVLSDEQKEAVRNIVKGNVSILTGSAGTGKTTVLKFIVEILDSFSMQIALCSPTGKAAKRMEELINKPASTIHRLLEYNPAYGGFAYNSETPLLYDIYVVDEVSMIDNYILYNLLVAVKDTSKIIFIGDEHQLESVGSGKILHDMLESGVINTSKLTTIYRQAQDSSIIVNANLIKNRKQLRIDQSKTDFIYREMGDSVENYYGHLDKLLDYYRDDLDSLQVLSPMKKGDLGTIKLNEYIQNKVNHSTLQILGFKLNDRVIHIINNYKLGVFNGDVGKVVAVDIKKGELSIKYSSITVTYKRQDLSQIKLAYAITIHKSQGSEFENVCLFLSKKHYMMLKNNLLYTAITRAKKRIYMLADSYAVNAAIANKNPSLRNTNLCDYLKNNTYEEKIC